MEGLAMTEYALEITMSNGSFIQSDYAMVDEDSVELMAEIALRSSSPAPWVKVNGEKIFLNRQHIVSIRILGRDFK